MKPSLSTLLKQRDIWQQSSYMCSSATISTGFSELDSALHGGGWPQANITELLSSQDGIDEWPLLLPTIKNLCGNYGQCILIAPPLHPSSLALTAAGISDKQLRILNTRDLAQTLWAVEQTLRSNACCAVVCWLGKQSLQQSQLCKLQRAAKTGNTAAFLYRDSKFSLHNSPATTRLTLSCQRNKLAINVIKQAGGWGGQHLVLDCNSNLGYRQKCIALPSFTDSTTKLSVENNKHSLNVTPAALSSLALTH
jgi:cell division inhibitor SulA/protein ImuA